MSLSLEEGDIFGQGVGGEVSCIGFLLEEAYVNVGELPVPIAVEGVPTIAIGTDNVVIVSVVSTLLFGFGGPSS